MKKGFLLCLLLGLMFTVGNTIDLFEPRIAGTAGSFISVVVDTADTVADPQGTAPVYDTTLSDTIDIGDYNFVTVYAKLVSIDTGSELTNDTLMDTIVIELITSINDGTSSWTVAKDTIVNVGDTFRHHFVVDTMLYQDIFFKTVYWDSIDPDVIDTNDYYFDIDVLGR